MGLSQVYEQLQFLAGREVDPRFAKQIERDSFSIRDGRPSQIALFGFSHVATLKQFRRNCTGKKPDEHCHTSLGRQSRTKNVDKLCP